MNKHEFEIYLELYKKNEFKYIPIGSYADGNYFYCTNKQIETLELLADNTTTSIGYGGSARSGKTVIEVTAIIFDCLAYNGIAWGLARKELTTLKRTALLTLFKQLSFYGFIQDRDFNYNQQLNKIVFYNRSEVFLIDTAYKPSDPLNTRFGGFELTRCAVDESNETAQDVIDKLFERTGWRLNEKYNLKRKVFECFNPAKNHVYLRFYKPFVDKLETLFRKFVLALPSDNPNPAVAEWIKDILADDKIPEATKQRQIYGNFEYDDNPYALFEYNNILNLFTNEFIKPTQTRYLTCDIAYTGSDKFVLIVWAGLVIEKIIAIDKIDDTQVSKRINELRIEHRIPLKNVIYDADGLQTFTRNSANSGVLSGATQFNNNAVPIKVNGKKENYKNLKAQCYFMLADMCKDNLLFIQEKNYRTQIIQELEQINRLAFSDDGKLALEKKDAIRERIGRSPDFADAIMMRMLPEIKGTQKVGIIWNN